MSTADPDDELPAWFRPPTSATPTPATASDGPDASDDAAPAEPEEPPPGSPESSGAFAVAPPTETPEPETPSSAPLVDTGPEPGALLESAPELAPESPPEAAQSQPDPAPEPAREPVELPEPPVTGDTAVDVALSELADVMAGSLEDQLAGYEQAHRVLQDRLADVEG